MKDEKKGKVEEPKKETPQVETKQLAKTEPSQAERFTNMVMKQFTDTAGDLKLTNFQKTLCRSYFIKIDQTLKDLEKKRMATKEQYRDALEFAWKNVNMNKLAVDVVAFSALGLDPTQPNHINCIPYKNKATSKFDFGFIIGYRGAELKVKKYGLDVPDDIVVELVYENDEFKPFKKDLNNKIEGYTFEIKDAFNRGELKGGFYYHKYFDKPERNKLRVFSMTDIEKRKPEYASVEFWGGEKDEWKDGKKTGKKEVVEGWLDEMAYKTIFRAAYNAITIDSQKIDDHYQTVLEKEREQRDVQVLTEIKENANRGEAIGFEEVAAEKSAPVAELQQETEEPVANSEEREPVQELFDNGKQGAGF